MVLVSLKHVLFSSIGALTLLRITVALPLFPSEDGKLQGRAVSEASLLDREVPDLELLEVRSDLAYDLLLKRSPPNQHRAGLPGPIAKEPKANPFKSKPRSSPASHAPPAQQPNGGGRKALPNNTKLRLSDAARHELDSMNLHGKDRRKAIKWHKNQVKQHMKSNPNLKGKAVTGVIEHLAHEGGSDMKEKNHITASFHDKNRQQIANSFNGGKNNHLYVSSMKGLPQQAKAGWHKNNADIRGQSHTHQTSLSKTATPGKSSTKGKGRQNPERNFSKNPAKGFQKKGR